MIKPPFFILLFLFHWNISFDCHHFSRQNDNTDTAQNNLNVFQKKQKKKTAAVHADNGRKNRPGLKQ